MSFTETMAVGRAFAESGEPPVRPNRELVATGLATLGGALLGGMSAGGGASQTAVNRLAGARSQLAGLVTGGVTLLTLLFLAPLISLMPQATLAAVVIVYSVGLIQLPEFRAISGGAAHRVHLGGLPRSPGVMLLGTLQGILVAIIISARWRSRTRSPTRRCTSSAASAARMCSDRCRPRTPTTRPSPAS